MAWLRTYDITTPDGSVDSPAEAADRMNEIKLATQERLNVEHVFDLTGTEVSHADTGKHTDITTISIVNAGALTQTGNLILNTDKFTVDAATGNVVVAGTLGVTGIATLGDGSKLATSAAPGADAELANKKYVDDHVGHDGDGYAYFDIDGVKTKVYTKFLTGNLDADSATNVAHGVVLALTKILGVSVAFYEDLGYSMFFLGDTRMSNNASYSCIWGYDATNIKFQSVGTTIQGNAYRIKIDYVL